MKKERVKIEDASGDRRYFTQIPNIIVNHSTAYEQSLYLIMKRVAGEFGSCYSSLNFLAKSMGVHKTTVSRTISKLLKRRWIQEIEAKTVRGGQTRQFMITDLWAFNLKLYESGADVPSSESGAISNESGAVVDGSGAKSDTKKIEKKNKEEKSSDSPESVPVFDLKAEIQKLKDSPRRTLRLIGQYIEEKSIKITSAAQLSVAIKRHLRAAGMLAPFDDAQIWEATKKVEKEYPQYTLETLVKFLTR